MKTAHAMESSKAILILANPLKSKCQSSDDLPGFISKALDFANKLPLASDPLKASLVYSLFSMHTDNSLIPDILNCISAKDPTLALAAAHVLLESPSSSVVANTLSFIAEKESNVAGRLALKIFHGSQSNPILQAECLEVLAEYFPVEAKNLAEQILKSDNIDPNIRGSARRVSALEITDAVANVSLENVSQIETPLPSLVAKVREFLFKDSSKFQELFADSGPLAVAAILAGSRKPDRTAAEACLAYLKENQPELWNAAQLS